MQALFYDVALEIAVGLKAFCDAHTSGCIMSSGKSMGEFCTIYTVSRGIRNWSHGTHGVILIAQYVIDRVHPTSFQLTHHNH